MGAELQILDMIQKLHNPVMDKLFVFITSLGNGGIIWILFMLVLLLIPKIRRTGVILAVTFVIDIVVCNGILKNVFARVRPCDVNKTVELLVARPHDYSFPSGHTAISFAAVSGLYFAGEKKMWKPALVLAVLMAFSRLYLYVHYPTDVLGGLIIGLLCGWIADVIIKKITERKSKAKA